MADYLITAINVHIFSTCNTYTYAILNLGSPRRDKTGLTNSNISVVIMPGLPVTSGRNSVWPLRAPNLAYL